MAFETREGEGSLFVNEHKETGQQPDYSGRVRIGGALYRLAGWRREAQSGKRWLSLKIQPDQGTAQGQGAEPAKAAEATAADKELPFDDEIPF